MEEALYSSTDFILMPIYLLVFFFIAQNIQRNNILTSLYYMINKIAKEEIYNINISIRDNQVFFN